MTDPIGLDHLVDLVVQHPGLAALQHHQNGMRDAQVQGNVGAAPTRFQLP